MDKKTLHKFRLDYSGELVNCIGYAILAGFPEHAKALHDMSLQAMGLTVRKNCDTMKPGEKPETIETEVKTMQEYIVHEYRTAPDGSEYETEQYKIAADELEETRAGLEELIGTAIDRYEIEKL